jgi:DNA-binding beta-propeller fold protein YncE
MTDLGLKEAKTAVERMEQGEAAADAVRHATLTETTQPSRRGCFIIGPALVLVALVALGIAIVVFVAEREDASGESGEAEFTQIVEELQATAIPGLVETAVGDSPSDFATETLSFGRGEGTGPGYFNDTRFLGLDAAGRLYTGDFEGGRIQVFDAAGNFLTQWQAANPDKPLVALSADREGRVYTIEAGDIYLYDGESGEQLGVFARGERGGYEDVAIAPDGSVVAFLGALGNDVLVWFDAEGNEKQRVDAIISAQTGDTVLSAQVAVDGAGNVYLLENAFGEAVFQYDATGKFLNRIGSRGDTEESFRTATALGVDHQGRVYVGTLSRIVVYANNGRFLGAIPLQGGVAFDMAVDDENDLWVMDRNGNRVVEFTLTGE